MFVQRPHVLLIQRRDVPEFSLESLFQVGAGVVTGSRWVALAPHLDEEVPLELDDLAVFDAVEGDEPVDCAALLHRFGKTRIDALLAKGLLIGDAPEHAALRQRDATLRETSWWAPAAVAHGFGRWQGIDVSADEQREGKRTLSGMIEKNGLPPPEFVELRPRSSWQALPEPARSPVDELLAARATCRNFDLAAQLPLQDLSTLMHRVFAAQGAQQLAPGATMLKKNSPSGGGLHPIDAYVLVQRVDGLAPGLYHYQHTSHALERLHDAPRADLAALAHELVAGQAWFAEAPVLVLMAARFQRNFWKYRNHPKSWKVIQLDAGHLSQNLYLTATELGYGAFVTGAINDRCAERIFELDGFGTGAIAVCGFGKRRAEQTSIEFDPLGKVAR